MAYFLLFNGRKTGLGRDFIKIKRLLVGIGCPSDAIEIPSNMQSDLDVLRITTLPASGDTLKSLIPDGWRAACALEISNSLLLLGNFVAYERFLKLIELAKCMNDSPIHNSTDNYLLVLSPQEYCEVS
jgi:hypothetical protein